MSASNPPLPVPISQAATVGFAADLLFPVAVPGNNVPSVVPGSALPGYLPAGTASLTIVTIPLARVELLATFSNPLVLVPAPGVGNTFAFGWSIYDVLYGGTAYVAGDGGPQIWYGTSVGTAFDSLALGPLFASTTNRVVQGATNLSTIRSRAAIENQPLVLASPSSNMTAGNGTGSLTIAYSIIPLTSS